jgi:glycosyltransferase involved in cell wall biosynthesis
LISIIVPCYNAAASIEECLCSVCSQSFEDLEVIVVDDGSTDESAALAEALAAREPRIRVIRQANGGVSVARNTGLDAARGEFIGFADADDRLLPGALDALFARMNADPAPDIVSSLHRQRDSGEGVRVIRPAIRRPTKNTSLGLLIEGDGVYNAVYNKLYRRALLKGRSIRFQAGLAVGEDALFNLEAYAQADRVVHLPAVTYEYRVHGASAMGGITKSGHYARHLPWLAHIRCLLARLGLREAFFRRYCYSHTLRASRSLGFLGMLRAFNGEIRTSVLQGVDRSKLRKSFLPMYGLVRAGLFPAVLCLVFPLLRPRAKAGRAVRWIVYFALAPLRLFRGSGGNTRCS